MVLVNLHRLQIARTAKRKIVYSSRIKLARPGRSIDRVPAGVVDRT